MQEFAEREAGARGGASCGTPQKKNLKKKDTDVCIERGRGARRSFVRSTTTKKDIKTKIDVCGERGRRARRSFVRNTTKKKKPTQKRLKRGL